VSDTPQLFDPDEFHSAPDPVAAHDAEIVDPTAVDEGDDIEDIEAEVEAEVEEDVEAEPVSQSVLDTVLAPDTVVERISLGAPPVLRSVAGGRHEARERAAHLLYEAEIKSRSVDDVLDEQVLAPDEYSADLVRGVARHRAELDEVIDRLARGWTVQRMPTMDVVVLRLAIYELAHRPEVPRGVVLSEAVDLAGQYGTDDSSKFVNGLLSAAANELRPG
jgi:N utilization substance protein B